MDPRHQAPWDRWDYVMAAVLALVVLTLFCGTYTIGNFIGWLFAWAGWI